MLRTAMIVDMGWSACLWNCRQVVVAHSNADDDNHEIQPDDSPGKTADSQWIRYGQQRGRMERTFGQRKYD